MVKRLKELEVTTYYWLIWHAPTDWDDLKLFLPKAAQAGVEVWVYLVPPSESPPLYGTQTSEPFRLDFNSWAEEIARLRGPVGLYIGSKTPPEIAVAILAEMTAVRHGVSEPSWAAKPERRFEASACEVKQT